MFIVAFSSVVTYRFCTLCTPTLPVELHTNFQRENDISLVVSSSFSWGKKVKCPEGSLLLPPHTPSYPPPPVLNVEIEKGNSFSSVFFSGLLPLLLKGTVQRELRWVKIGINRTARINCIAGKCNFPCPKGHHHESIINVLGAAVILFDAIPTGWVSKHNSVGLIPLQRRNTDAAQG